MPRKKLEKPTVEETPVETTKVTAEQPKPRRTATKAVAASSASKGVTAKPSTKTAPATKKATAKAVAAEPIVPEPIAEITPAPAKKAGPRARKTAAAVPETAPSVEQEVKETKPKARRATAKTVKAVAVEPTQPEVSEEVSEVKVAKKPTTSRRSKAAKPSIASTPEGTSPISAVAASDELSAAEDVSGIVISFRPRTKGGKRGGSRTAVVAAPVVVEETPVETDEVVDIVLDGDHDPVLHDLPIPRWRTKGATEPVEAPGSSEAEQTEATEEDVMTFGATVDEDNSPRGRNRRRRRRDPRRKDGTPEVATKPEAPVRAESVTTKTPTTKPEAKSEPKQEVKPEPKAEPVKAPKLAAKPVKPAIPVPAEAPQVVVREGIPTLVRDHRVYPPLIFFGSPSDERRAETVFEELRLATEAGLHLHSFLIDVEVNTATVEESVQFAAYCLNKAVEIDPEAQVLFRVVFQAPRNWEHRFPNARYRTAQGEVAEPSLCDDEFWGTADQCLDRFVRLLCLLPAHGHILGVHLDRGEWFFSEGVGYDTSKAAVIKFRDWARRRYLADEVTLRASWFDGTVSFDNIQVPEFNPEGGDGDRFIRSSRKQRRYVDFHLFLSDVTVGRIADLAYTAKAASAGMFLVGTSYGYTFEWSHPGNGHLALGKLLRTQEIDFIAGPPSYRNREPGGSAPFPGPIDSFALNGKLYLSEEDYKTSLSVGHEQDDFNPALKTPQALENVHWRGVGAALAHGCGVKWMDLWGNGWLRTNSVWERATRVQSILTQRMKTPLGDPDVAVFIDERALAYLVDSNAFTLLVQNVRESVLRAGVSAAFYLLSDLQHREKFPESKLYLFLNAWDIRPDLRAAIKSRLQRDDKVLLWLYSAGLFDAGRDSLERAREVTGIALKPQPFHSKAGTTILNRRHPLSEAFPDRSLIGGTKLEPSYFAIPEEGVVLGEYTQTGLPSFVIKEFDEDPQARWTSVFLGEPLVNPALVRALAQMAGCHVWNFHEDVVHVRAPFCTVHCSGTGPRTITLPDKYSAYNLVTQEWAAIDSSNLRFTALDGSTHVFLVGPKVDIEHLLQVPDSEVLHLDELPPRETNIRIDSSNFDVPIMKLDEWIGTSDDDEVADEWFLRPHQLLQDPEPEQAQAEESPGKVGRRRRRRRGRGSNGERYGSDEPTEVGAQTFAPPTAEFDDLGMNVMFRKRD